MAAGLRTREERAPSLGYSAKADEVDVVLILSVRARPELWEHRLAFDGKQERDRAWKEVLEEVRSSSLPDVASCEKRWKLMRDRYARERKKQGQTPGPEEDPPWPLWQQLSFLRDTVRSRNRRSMRHSHTAFIPPPRPGPPGRPPVTRKYFQVSFPDGNLQMKADPLSMEQSPVTPTAQSVAGLDARTKSGRRQGASSDASPIRRHSIDLAAEHPSNAGPSTVANGNDGVHARPTTVGGSTGGATATSSSNIRCLTSSLSAAVVDVLPVLAVHSPSPAAMASASDVVVVAASSVPTADLLASVSRGGVASSARHSAFSVPVAPDNGASPMRPKPGRSVISPATVSRGGATTRFDDVAKLAAQEASVSLLDEEALFGAQVAATLRRLPEFSRLKLRFRIQESIYNFLSADERDRSS